MTRIILMHYAEALLSETTELYDELMKALGRKPVGWIAVSAVWATQRALALGYGSLEAFMADHTADTTKGWALDALRADVLLGFGWRKEAFSEPETVVLTHYVDSLLVDNPALHDEFCSGDRDNLGWIAVPAAWVTQGALDLGYASLEAFMDDYTADTTDGWALAARRKGVLCGFGWGTAPE